MRWKVKTKSNKNYKNGEERIVELPYFIPTKVGEYWYLFERMLVLQKYIKKITYEYDYGGVFHPVNNSYWKNIRIATDEDLGFYYGN